MRKNRDFQKGKNNRARFGIAVFCLIMSVTVVFGNICGCSAKKPSANDMTPYEYLSIVRSTVFVGGDGSLYTTVGRTVKKAFLSKWEPCEDLSGEQGKESDVELELVGMHEKYNMIVLCNIINNGSENLTSNHVELQVKLEGEWYPALNMYFSDLRQYSTFVVYPGESEQSGVDLMTKNILDYKNALEHNVVVPPGRYRLVYTDTEIPAYLEFDLIEKDGVLSAVAAQ